MPGQYVAGEVTDGIYGDNRPGGNSLLDYVVFGCVSAEAVRKHMLGADNKHLL